MHFYKLLDEAWIESQDPPPPTPCAASQQSLGVSDSVISEAEGGHHPWLGLSVPSDQRWLLGIFSLHAKRKIVAFVSKGVYEWNGCDILN